MAVFVVLYTEPNVNSTDVELLPTFSVTFNEDVDETTVTADSFLVSRLDTGVAVPVTIEDIGSKLVTFIPAESLATGTKYSITVKDGIKSIFNRRLQMPYTWYVTTTEAAALSTPVISSPADSSSVTAFSITWGAIASATYYVLRISQDEEFTAYSDYTVLAPAVSFSSTQLTAGTYLAKVKAVEINEDGTFESEFSTVVVFTYAQVLTDDEIPPSAGDLWGTELSRDNSVYLVRATPVSGSINKAVTSVSLVFNTDLEGSSGTPADVLASLPDWEVTPLIGADYTALDGTWAISDDGTTLTYTGTFAQNTTYSLALEEITNDEELPLLEAISYWFTTSLQPLYARPSQLRKKLGILAEDLTDAELYEYLHTASVAVTTRVNGTYEDGDVVTTLTPAIAQEAVIRAAIEIISMRLAEVGYIGSEQKVLGDFSYTLNASQSVQLAGVLDDLQAELLSVTGAMYSTLKTEALLSVTGTGPQVQVRSTF
jgi:hypothetical protein